MPNIGIALASSTLIGGVVFLLALLAYEKYQESQRTQRTHDYRSSSPPRGSRGNPPPQPSNDCSICRDQLTSPLEILPCGHLFHRQCIKQWFLRRMVCPVCRSRIADEMVEDYTRRLGL